MKTIGVIGGMGPGATLDLFQKIIQSTPADRDQDHLHVIIDNLPQVPDRTAYLLAGGESPLPYLIRSAERLVGSGALALCMPCNTAHYFVEEIRKTVPVPFLSIVESALQEIRECHPRAGKVGLMATKGTTAGKIYHNLFEREGLEILPLSPGFEEALMDIIYGVKAGRLQEKVDNFQKCLNAMAQMGAEVIIAGCTEIPLLIPFVEVPVPVVDPTLALAKNAVRFAKGASGASPADHLGHGLIESF